MMDMIFENPGLCHIGEKIFQNLDFVNQLNWRLVQRSWKNLFEKEASRIDLEKYLSSKIPPGKDVLHVEMWTDLINKLRTIVPPSLIKFYFDELFRKNYHHLSKLIIETNYRPPLVVFACIGNSKMVRFILPSKPISVWLGHHMLALRFAARNGHVEIVKYLKSCISSEIPTITHRNAIIYAIENGHLETVKVLIDYLTNLIDVPIGTFINLAKDIGHIEILKYLRLKFYNWKT